MHFPVIWQASMFYAKPVYLSTVLANAWHICLVYKPQTHVKYARAHFLC